MDFSELLFELLFKIMDYSGHDECNDRTEVEQQACRSLELGTPQEASNQGFCYQFQVRDRPAKSWVTLDV
jgi:hypothetical protein